VKAIKASKATICTRCKRQIRRGQLILPDFREAKRMYGHLDCITPKEKVTT